MNKRGICMSTLIRPEIRKDSPYYISKHRYYELKHFCLQYPEFKKTYNLLCEKIPSGLICQNNSDGLSIQERDMVLRDRYLSDMELIEECSRLTDPILGTYIFKGVTEGRTYSYFRTRGDIPCCKDTYYDLYRKFFFILSRKKQRVL